MTSLALRLQKHSVTTSMGAVATLQRVADETGAAVRGDKRLDVIIPANAGGDARRVAVDPGRWLVEATLPSGEVISDEVVVASGQDVPVTLYAAERSPHEWLGWQHLVGNIEGAETLRLLRNRAREAVVMAKETLERAAPSTERPLTWRRAKELISKVGKFGLDTFSPSKVVPPKVHLSEEKRSLQGAEAWTTIFAPDPAAAPPCSPLVEAPNEATWLYQFTGPAQLSLRQFAHVDWLGERFIVSLPLPWPALRDHQRVPVQMMVRMAPLVREVRIGVVVQDPDFGTMAGLMTASTLPQAAIAVNQAHDMLYGKMEHPLGAVAGGYVLLAAGDREKSDWHAWIDNLDARFPDIPDGAILKASLRLRFPKNKDSPAEARIALLNAFDRGIPYYSAGISWLLDGLTVFADDQAVQEKLTLVQRVAFRLDLSQAFTVIRASDKAKR